MRRFRLSAFFLAAGALASPTSPAPPESDIYAPGREIVAGLGKIVTPHGVDETFEATLGGARQMVNVRGADRANPILLFIHGGPASPEMPLAWSFQRPWEGFFTVVQWDQRGFGNEDFVLATYDEHGRRTDPIRRPSRNSQYYS
jgi:pimeloyl-ACP methyl ester carboxylesterase